MTASIQSAEQASAPVSQNPAVLICCNAYHTTYEKAIAAKHGNVFSELEAEAAFRAAMPPLSGYQNICDFIACTAYGLLIRSIKADHAERLIAAAKVARSMLIDQPAPPEDHASGRSKRAKRPGSRFRNVAQNTKIGEI